MSTGRPNSLCSKLRRMNALYLELEKRFADTQISALGVLEIDKLTRAVEELLELVQDSEQTVQTYNSQHSARNSTALIRAKLIVRERKIQAQEALCQEEEKELIRLADETEEAKAVLRDEENTLKQLWNAAREEHRDLENKWHENYNRKQFLKQKEKEIESLRETNQQNIQKVFSKIKKYESDLSNADSTIHDLEKQIEELKKQERETEHQQNLLRQTASAQDSEENFIKEREADMKDRLAQIQHKEGYIKMKRDMESQIELRLKGLKMSQELSARVHMKNAW